MPLGLKVLNKFQSIVLRRYFLESLVYLQHFQIDLIWDLTLPLSSPALQLPRAAPCLLGCPTLSGIFVDRSILWRAIKL